MNHVIISLQPQEKNHNKFVKQEKESQQELAKLLQHKSVIFIFFQAN